MTIYISDNYYHLHSYIISVSVYGTKEPEWRLNDITTLHWNLLLLLIYRLTILLLIDAITNKI